MNLGLTKKVQQSTISEGEAEKQVCSNYTMWQALFLSELSFYQLSYWMDTVFLYIFNEVEIMLSLSYWQMK